MGTPNDVYHILTLRLPGNVERVVNDLRSLIHHETAAASTQGIPSVIPLAYVSPNTRRELVATLPQTEIPPLQIGRMEIHNDTLVLCTVMDDHWNRWLENVATAPPPPGMPAPCSGVFLGGPDSLGQSAGARTRSEWELTATPANRMPKRLAVLNVELMKLTTGTTAEWWRNLDWKVLWSKRIKLRG
jgi:hypothetical protein